jgi:hypothetical protein
MMAAGQEQDLKDYRIVAKIRNNRIATLIESTGLSPYKFCHKHGIAYQRVIGFIAMTEPAKGARGEWKKAAHDLATVFRCLPEDLFNERQIKADFAVTTITRETSDENILPPPIQLPALASPEARLERDDALRMLMSTVSSRTREILERYFGLGEYPPQSVVDIARQFKLSPARIHQIIHISLGRMKQQAWKAGLVATDFTGEA